MDDVEKIRKPYQKKKETDERLLHTILVSAHLHLVLQKVAGRTILGFPAKAHHHLEGGSIQLILRAWGHSDSWVLFAGEGPSV
jgi:hypothetical protein